MLIFFLFGHLEGRLFRAPTNKKILTYNWVCKHDTLPNGSTFITMVELRIMHPSIFWKYKFSHRFWKFVRKKKSLRRILILRPLFSESFDPPIILF
jgi:hypothetical protein